MELSRKFIWVWVDRDKTPIIPKEFNIYGYPTLLTLNAKREMVHRFTGYKEAPRFLEALEEALSCFKLYLQGKEWIKLPPRAKSLTKDFEVSTIPVLRQSRIGGITVLGNDLWLAQNGRLIKLDVKTGKVRDEFLVSTTSDICTDGKVLYLGAYGWTKGNPIRVVDPADGTVIREIVTRKNLGNRASGSFGIAYRNGMLFVGGMRGKIHEIDPATGDITQTFKIGNIRHGAMTFNGDDLLVACFDHLARIDPATGKTMGKIPMNHPVSLVSMDGDQILLAEKWIYGYTKDHKKIRIYPETIEISRLTPWR